MKLKSLLVAAAFTVLITTQTPAQAILNKLKQKAGEKALDKITGKPNTSTPPKTTSPNPEVNTTTEKGNDPSNKTGGGLISTPPDVNQNLLDAGAAYKTGSYGEARYAVQQAMLGVELEIGNKILQSLPQSVSGLRSQEADDQVTSTGYGWAGLTIHREYSDDKEKELRITIANNAAWMSAVNMYLTGGGYAQTTGGQQNWKQTKVKGHRAIIEYDESSGYKLSVPLGQSSMIVYEGINFVSEPEMMTAASSIDIEGIKKMLGEN